MSGPPADAPTTTPLTVASTFSVTVYVPFRSMNAVCSAVGTVFVFQLLATFHSPPAGLIQWTSVTTGFVIAKGALVAAVKPALDATSV